MIIFFPLGAFYPSQIGGPCNTLYWHTRALNQNGINPIIVTSTVGIDNNIVNSDKWLDLDCGRTYYGQGRTLRLKTILTALVKINKVDILHLNSLFSPISSLSFIYAILFSQKIKIIWSVRGELNKNALQFSNWKKKPFLFFYKNFNKNVTYHSTSDEETKHIKEMFPHSKVVQLPNYIDPAPRLNLIKSNYLLFLGRIHQIKAIHKLIEALSYSEKFKNSDFQLYIVGKQEERHNNYKAQLVEQIRSLGLSHKIVFKGHVEGEEKEMLYAKAYALILPSETENFGNVVVEALNHGTPVIASRGTPWSILETYKAGYHCSNDPELLSKAIDKLLSLSQIDYNEMSANSIKLVEDKFDVNSNILKWITVYKQVLNENSK